MATIDPSSNIRLLKGVPLDNTYTNTVAFSSASAQESYFTGKSIFPVDDSQYQRADKGTLKIKKPIDELFGCNYLMFNNKSFENKWIYAFVTRVEYISNNATLIEYEIDVIQTWLFDMDVLDSYVERETPSSDGYTSHNLTEPLTFPDTAYDMTEITPNTGSDLLSQELVYAVAVGEITREDGEIQTPDSHLISGCPCALTIWLVKQASSLKGLLENGQSDHVIFITAVPKIFWEKFIVNESVVAFPISKDLPKIEQFIVFSSDQIRQNINNVNWNKARKYPYQSLVVMFGEQIVEFSPQNFDGNGDAEFKLTYSFSASPTLVLETVNYSNKNIFIESGFPSVPWSDSIYAQKVASDNSIRANMIFSAISNPTLQGVGMSVVNAAYQQAQSNFNFAHTTPPAHSYSNDNSALVTNRLLPRFYLKTLKPDIAKSLDDFFTKFGYSTNRLKKFTKTSNKNYKYIKTLTCTITGNIPSDYLSKIKSIHDNGITYWNSASNVGNY